MGFVSIFMCLPFRVLLLVQLCVQQDSASKGKGANDPKKGILRGHVPHF